MFAGTTIPKEMSHIRKVDPKQITFCRKLGLDVDGNTIGQAAAKIHDFLAREFYGESNPGKPTEKQIQLAGRFGHDISSLTRREGDAVISDIMTQLNLESIKEQKLAPGVSVVNRWDRLQRV